MYKYENGNKSSIFAKQLRQNIQFKRVLRDKLHFLQIISIIIICNLSPGIDATKIYEMITFYG